MVFFLQKPKVPYEGRSYPGSGEVRGGQDGHDGQDGLVIGAFDFRVLD
jgi:hypothetical protein